MGGCWPSQGGPPRLLILSKALVFILSNASRGMAVCAALTEARSSTAFNGARFLSPVKRE